MGRGAISWMRAALVEESQQVWAGLPVVRKGVARRVLVQAFFPVAEQVGLQ